MDHQAVPQSQIPHTPRLFQDFLYDFSRVSEFYSFPPFEATSYAKSAVSLPYPAEMRAGLVSALREQHETRPASPETARNLERLAQPGCCAVVTGQQAGLFTGPAFTIYKALTAIKLARHLTRQGIEAVPVFWLATEDHDLAEVNHCFVQDREGKPVELRYDEPAPVPNAPVGAVAFNETVRTMLEALRSALPDTPDAGGLVRMVEEAYQPGIRFGNAFAHLLGQLLSKYGVLMVEAGDARLHRLSSSIFRTAIECAGEIASDLRARDEELIQNGYHAQVRVTESSTTLFLYEEGQRSALHLENGKFVSSLGTRYERPELLRMLQTSPALFSPNALLRPVMQDALLPTVAYVGGPSEIAYLAQAEVLYQRILNRMPVVFPRAGFTVVDPASNRLLGKYGMTLTDIFAGRQALREKMAARFLPEDLMQQFARAASSLSADLEAIRESLQKLDPTLVDAAHNSAQKMQYQLSSLERKAAAAVQSRSDQVERDATRLENSLFPDKKPQERVYSGISLLARFGMALLDQLYEAIRLDSGDHLVIAPQ